MAPKPQIQYLNTDLDLVSDQSLDLLHSELLAQNLCGHLTLGDDGLFYATFEGFNDSEPEPNIIKLLEGLDNLTADAARLLRHSKRIEFNIGYACGDEPWSFNQGISNGTLLRIAQHRGCLRFTIYPYIAPGDSRIKHTDLTGDS